MVVNTGLFLFSPSFFSCALAPSVIRVASDSNHYPIYKENAREYAVLHTADWGCLLMMEVGALMVGKIVNHHGAAYVSRGQEKGYFQFGGSTVVLLVEKDRLILNDPYPENSARGIETRVRYGQPIGRKPPRQS